MWTVEMWDTVTGATTRRATVASKADAQAWARSNRRRGQRARYYAPAA